jgi:hypothetical protein
MKKKIMMDQTKRILLPSLGLLAAAGLALADDTTSGYSGLENMEGPQVEHVFQVNPGFTYTSEADFDRDGLGKVSVWRFDVPGRYTMKTEAGDLSLGAFYEFSEYDLDRVDNHQDFNTLSFDTLWKGMVNEEWGYFLYGAIGLSASSHADLTDGLTGMGGGGVRYVWSKDLSLGLGAAIATHLEQDPTLWPIIALNWQIDDRWNLRVLNGAIISYDVTGDKKFLLDLGAKYQRREYRTRDDNVSFIDKSFTFELGATYRFCENFALRGFGGVAAGRTFETYEKKDRKFDEDVDPAIILGVRALFTF